VVSALAEFARHEGAGVRDGGLPLQVYLAKLKGAMTVAVKRMRFEDRAQKASFLREVKLLRELTASNVVQYQVSGAGGHLSIYRGSIDIFSSVIGCSGMIAEIEVRALGMARGELA
jgi:hypothetical protein